MHSNTAGLHIRTGLYLYRPVPVLFEVLPRDGALRSGRASRFTFLVVEQPCSSSVMLQTAEAIFERLAAPGQSAESVAGAYKELRELFQRPDLDTLEETDFLFANRHR